MKDYLAWQMCLPNLWCGLSNETADIRFQNDGGQPARQHATVIPAVQIRGITCSMWSRGQRRSRCPSTPAGRRSFSTNKARGCDRQHLSAALQLENHLLISPAGAHLYSAQVLRSPSTQPLRAITAPQCEMYGDRASRPLTPAERLLLKSLIRGLALFISGVV